MKESISLIAFFYIEDGKGIHVLLPTYFYTLFIHFYNFYTLLIILLYIIYFYTLLIIFQFFSFFKEMRYNGHITLCKFEVYKYWFDTFTFYSDYGNST